LGWRGARASISAEESTAVIAPTNFSIPTESTPLPQAMSRRRVSGRQGSPWASLVKKPGE
jgi:hypothetical protein